MSNVIPFDPTRRQPRTLERFQRQTHTELLPVWVDGEITVSNLWKGLQSVGLTIKTADNGRGFIIAKA